jgi:hypothetical protein
MRTIHRSRTVFSAFVAVLAFALVAPIAVNADDEVVTTDEQVLAPAPAIPSWDETSGYGSVEASRSELSALLSGEMNSGQEQAIALAAAAATSWDETSGYGAVESSRAAASGLLAPVVAPSTCADDMPAAVASGRRAESTHLATVPLPGEDAADAGLVDC